LARPEVILASSSSGLLPTDIQAFAKHPERILIGHPFNPVYLLPLVEIVGGKQTSQATITQAKVFYKQLAMHPLLVRNEIEGYLADRLQEALWREILHLVNDGIATTGELDEAIIYGPGLRWAFMGTNLTYHLAGGESGMRHMLEQFGPALKLPWTKLEAPELTNSLIDKMVEGTQAQAHNRSIKELERLRDNCLISVMRALQEHQIASGKIMTELDGKRFQASHEQVWQDGASVAAPLELFKCKVSPLWIDYNGHMTEASYLSAFGEASDQLFRYVGINESYRNEGKGHSFYTVESHINYYQEVGSGEPLRFTTQIIGLDEKRLHIFHSMIHANTGVLLATTEQMLLHVDMRKSKAAPILPSVYEALEAIYKAHKTLQMPEQVGRQMKLA
jgi:carnitine 3-dehydrogenase